MEKPDTHLWHCINPWLTHISHLVCSSGLSAPSLPEGLPWVTEQSDHRLRKPQQAVEDSFKSVLPTNSPCSCLSLQIHLQPPRDKIKEVEVDPFWSLNEPFLLCHSLHPQRPLRAVNRSATRTHCLQLLCKQQHFLIPAQLFPLRLAALLLLLQTQIPHFRNAPGLCTSQHTHT